MNKIYGFFYNSCTYESSDTLMSLHYTKEGAEKAMLAHKEAMLNEFNENFSKDDDIIFGTYERWIITEFKISV